MTKQHKWIGPPPAPLPKPRIGGRPPIHGGRNSPTYKSWARIRQAHLTGKHKHTPRWREYAKFLEDMGERPEGAELRRKDASEGYTRDNCYWYTPKDDACTGKTNP